MYIIKNGLLTNSMIETLNDWDHQLMLLLNGDGGEFFDQFWYIYSGKFTWIPLYILLLWLMVKRCLKNKNIDFWKHFTITVFCIVLLILLSDQLASGLIKPLVCRPRPSHEPGLMEQLHYVNDYHGGAFGFVSSHASNSIAIALFMGWLLWGYAKEELGKVQKKWGKVFFSALIIWALLNCYSRIYLGVHYPGDILGGLFIGIISFLIIKALYLWSIKKMSANL